MNWIIDDSGRARFRDESSSWWLGTDPARPEAGLWIDRRPEAEVIESAAPSVRLLPPPGTQFPPLAEVYVRGSDLIANLPQTADTEFGLNLCHRILRATSELIVCETIVAIQTDLLDSHPTLDLVCDAAGRALENIEPVGIGTGGDALINASSDKRAASSPPAAIQLDERPRSGVCVILLPPSDRAVAEDRSQLAESRTAESRTAESRTAESRTAESRTAESRTAESRTAESRTAGARIRETGAAPPICFRLLAEFLEKGVIRKARYWTCRWAEEPSEAAVAELYRELLHIPLPLTP